MLAVLILVLVFIAIVLRTIIRWKGAWRFAASLPLVIMGVAVINIVLDPASHNLLPIELIMWVFLGFIVLGIVAAVRSRVLGISNDGNIRGN